MILKIFILISLIASFDLVAKERFLVVANAVIPNMSESLRSISQFSDSVMPGSNVFIAGAVIAMNFNPKFRSLNMNSKFRFTGCVDQENQASLPLFYGVVDKRGKKKPAKKVKISKKFKLYTKVLDENVLLSQSKVLLKNINSIPKLKTSSSDIFLSIYPKKYVEKSSQNFIFFKKKILKDYSKKDYLYNVIEGLLSESLFVQCEKLDVNINLEPSNINLNLYLMPTEGSKLSKAIKKAKNESLSLKDFQLIIEETLGKNVFNSDKGMDLLISTFLVSLFTKKHALVEKNLFSFDLSINKSALICSTTITDKKLRDLLLSVGVIKYNK